MSKQSMKDFISSSYFNGGNAEYLENLLENYIQDPQSVPVEWQNYFVNIPTDISHAAIREEFLQNARRPKFSQAAVPTDVMHAVKQNSVNKLIEAYREHGHLTANLDPLGSPRDKVNMLEASYYGLSPNDFNETFEAPESLVGKKQATLKEIVDNLQKLYCGTIAAEFVYITSSQAEEEWIKDYFEKGYRTFSLSAEQKQHLLKDLIAADGLEKYLGNKYVGQKRFALEGGDALIPFINGIVDKAGNNGIKEIDIGMAHRGRLNVLINVCGQDSLNLFKEFEGTKDYGLNSGDVKYHLGFSSDVVTSGSPVHLSLAFNPSHLEVISSVVMGSVRARQDQIAEGKKSSVMAIIVHGDAAVAGQGIVMETLAMSNTNAYSIGGAIHIVVNNQVGFTTSNPHDARSSRYCTDIAKMIEAPVFHVNADDPEAVAFLAQLAFDYRQTFNKDIFIDLVCYRRHGHNEADEPMATQPLMYAKIKNHPAAREIYAKQLIASGVCKEDQVNAWVEEYKKSLDSGKSLREVAKAESYRLAVAWTKYIGQEWSADADTSVNLKDLQRISKQLYEFPEGFEIQRQVALVMSARKKMCDGELPMDWGFAENLAYATLLNQGYNIRMSGQDVRRGTFAHRHAALHDQNTDEVYVPLQHLEIKNHARFQIYDSVLSEEGVLGFEYGYSKAAPADLVIWEAQFGDFANGAQVIVDQFISSGWQKWQRLCGLVMLLPHGYEGMGPEHSSARLERYLQLCAEHNMQVCVPSTPSQIFHLLRRQVIRPFRAPMIVMTPKSLLRHKLAVSTLDELANGRYQLVIPEIDEINPADVKRIILCSGKVYYDLLEARRENKRNDIAILRIEQLYPFPYDELEAALATYKKASEVVWCQEEPKNQGAWFITHHRLVACIGDKRTLKYAGRSASAAPAVGYHGLHKQQAEQLVHDALN